MKPYFRVLHSLACGSALASSLAQCGPYKYHPLWPDTLGSAHVILGECTGATSVLWDNGDTSPATSGLTVGPHTVTFLDGTTPIATNDFTIEQQVWDFTLSAMGEGPTLSVIITAEVDRCAPQIFNGLDCHPIPAQTVLRLLQDGIAVDSLTPVDCIYTLYSFSGLPFGHTYGCAVATSGACPSYGEGPVATAYDCSGFSMDIETQDDQGGGTGTVIVTELIPGPPGPFTPPPPIAGHFVLVDAGMNMIGDPQPDTPAEWNGLAAGNYTVFFINDTLCSPVMQALVIASSTGILAQVGTSSALWPVPVSNMLHWSGSGPCRIQVLDPLGRMVLRAQGIDQVDVSSLVAGSYLLKLDSDPPRPFMKR